jgi:hypothetical protein
MERFGVTKIEIMQNSFKIILEDSNLLVCYALSTVRFNTTAG